MYKRCLFILLSYITFYTSFGNINSSSTSPSSTNSPSVSINMMNTASTFTPSATSSVVTYSTLNFCANSGKTITLPFIGSSTNIMTNAVGGSYINSANCNVYINGAGAAQGFQINITNFNTENGLDLLRIYNSAGTLLYTYSGNLVPFNLYITGTSSVQLLFTTDGSVVGSGVNAIVSIVFSSLSGSPSQSSSLSNSPNPSSSPIGSRNVTKSPLTSISTIKSNTISSSSSQSKTSTISIESTDSLRNSRTNTATASSSATVFYSGNWTDYGKVYFTSYIQVLSSLTINQCMISCWLDPLCGGISVNWGCSDIDLDSSQIFTLLCTNCRTIPKTTEIDTYPGTFNQHSEWKSFIIYDKIFPPTISPISSRTPTISEKPTSSVVTYNTINYCTNLGTSVTLPFIGSTLMTMSNVQGSNYINNLACSVNVYGAGNSQQFRINITSFNTEGCCDFFTVYNSNNNILARYSGSVESGTNFIVSGSFIRIAFTTDGSVVATGVFATVTLEYASSSVSSSTSASPSVSNSISNSPLLSISSIKSLLNTRSASVSSSYSSTISLSICNSLSPSYSSLPRTSQTPIRTKTSINTLSSTSRQTESISNTLTTSISPSPSPQILLPFALPPKDSNYNTEVTNQLNNYLDDLLSGGGVLPPAQALNVINNIPQVGVSDTMNILKKLGGVIAAPISFSSTSFEGALAPIKNTTVEVKSSSYNINVPVIPNLPPNSAVVAISWSNETVFSNETTLSNIMSVSVSNKGIDQDVKNLTNPIVLSWNISNIITPPNMTLKCSYWNYTSLSWSSDGCNITISLNRLTCECDHMTDFVARFERIAKMNKDIFANAGNVYSLDGLTKYKNYYIFFGTYFLLMILIGIGLQQLDIKNSEQYLHSLKHNFDIIKMKKEIKNFYIDKCYITDVIDEFDEYNEYKIHKYTLINKIYKQLDHKLFKNKDDLIHYIHLFVEEELELDHHVEKINNDSSTIDSEIKKEKDSFCTNIYNIVSLWWKRLLYQHNYLSIFFKYDPQSPRIFRIFFIFTVISHTLFMTALLYGYLHENDGSTDTASPIESIVLSIITSIINVPFMNFIMRVLQMAGKSEFAWRYPFIFREINKMIIFEEVYYNSNKSKEKSNDLIVDKDEDDEDNIITNIIVNYLCKYCYCYNRNKNKVVDNDQLFKERIDKEIVKLRDIPLDSQWWYTNYIPFHTLKSTLSFVGCLGYLLWTINYLLLFSANNQPNIQIQILTSFGISQLFSIILITPITLLITLFLTWVYHKYFKKTSFASNIVPIYFHSDPFINEKSFGLTVRLTKSLFLKSIAESSIHQPTDPRIIAPVKGLIAHMLKEDIRDHILDKDYYDKIVKYNNINKTIN